MPRAIAAINDATAKQRMLDDTIAAIATPLGEGGLAVVRISGPQALAMAERSFAPLGKSALKPSAAPTHTLHYGKIMREGRSVDEVMVAVMRAPRTLTREDVVEITCHGGLLRGEAGAGHGAGKRRAAGRAGGIHPARVSQRADRPGAGRGGGGFDPCAHGTGAGGGQRTIGRKTFAAHQSAAG